MKPNKSFLFSLAFIEGGGVMASELLGAKMITPFFGSSLYVWAAVLGVTLGALMCGYYLGGYLSEKIKKDSLVYWLLIIAGSILAFMPYTSEWVMKSTIEMSVQTGSTLSLLVFLFPPLLFMGMTSPVIINMINNSIDKTGRTAGSVYAISTMGGIISTFLMGFYLMPEFGIKKPALAFGAMMVIPSAVYLVGKNRSAALLPLLFMVFIFFLIARPDKTHSSLFNIRYESEGILGQIKVIDLDFHTATRGVKKGRILYVNNTGQTIADLNNPEYSLWDWAYYYATAASIYPAESKVLLMGLGGGSFVHQFERLGFQTDIVELDERIKEVAIDYFAVDPSANIIIDDARHYINTCNKKYNLITLDLFLNETPPAHMLTLEAFNRIKQLLEPEGMVMINFYGYISGEKGKPLRSLIKTLQESGYLVKLFPTPGREDNRNMIILASLEEKNFSSLRYAEPGLPRLINLEPYFIHPSQLEMTDAIVLRDKLPNLEKMYIQAAIDWRNDVSEYHTKRFIKDKLKTFK